MRTILLAGLGAVALAFALAGCSTAVPTAPSAHPYSNVPSTVAPTSSVRLPSQVASDALGMLVRDGERWSASNEPSKLDTAAAIGKTSFVSSGTSAPVIAATKVRLTDAGVKNRLVWVVGAEPVVLRMHGPRGTNHSPVGLEVVVIDAQTGRPFEGFGGTP